MICTSVMCAAGLLLAGCGGESDDGGAGAAAEVRTVTHAMGTAEITGRPERVVVLDTGELDSAVALGVTPVGAVEAITGEGFPDYLADAAEGVELVGTIEQPSLETIARLEPDLILSSKIRHEAIYDELQRIAPTVFTETIGVTWKENFALHAEALGLAAEGEALMGEYRQALAGLQEALGDRLGDTEVSVVRSVGDEVRIYLKDNFIGTILSDVGLPRPPAQDVADFSNTATIERMAELDGDVMFLSRFGSEHRILEDLMASPLWDELGVVRRDDVYEVPDDLWFLGIGNLAARLIVQDLETVLVDGRPLEAATAETAAG